MPVVTRFGQAAAGGLPSSLDEDDGAQRPRNWIRLAQYAWVGLAVLAAILTFRAIPQRVDEFQMVCTATICTDGQLSSAALQTLRQQGLSLEVYSAYRLALMLMTAAGSAAIGVMLFVRRPYEPMALLVSSMLVAMGADFVVSGNGFLESSVGFLAWASFILFFYLFPTGQFVPRWTWVPAVGFVSGQFLWHFVPRVESWPLWINAPAFLGLWLTGLVIQVYRFRRVSTPAQRQQTKWVTFGVSIVVLTYTAAIVFLAISPASAEAGSSYDLFVEPLLDLVFLSIPLTIGVATLRYRLWDIDAIVNRTLVYLALTAMVTGVYILVVGSLHALLQSRSNLLVSLVATGIAAVLFQPMRDRLQQGVNRLMYGERDEPYTILSRLGSRLEATQAPDAVLQSIVETVREALKLPYAAISLLNDEQLSIAAADGAPTDAALRLPLVYQQHVVGELILAPRSPGEAFSMTDRRLLNDLARQIGIAAHNVRLGEETLRLNADLQRSRERLVLAREEERRRLRRELHDGLAPTLAALNLKAGSIRRLVQLDPDAAENTVGEWQAELRTTITNIRRLAYELRPPTLDELGLVAAIRERATQMTVTHLRVTVDAPRQLESLPAAVEVAAYRIVQEALTNVERHARATDCLVRLRADEGREASLCLEITDDGVGIPDETSRRHGVGLLSMRERTEELGGTCLIERGVDGGTHVFARIPIVRE